MIKYSGSPVIVVSPEASIWPFPRYKISLSLLLAWTNELLSTPEIITFLATPLPFDS